MGTVDLSKNPPAYHAAAFHAQKPSGGLRKAPAHEDLQQAALRLLEDETDNALNHCKDKLPPEILKRVTMSNLREKLYNSINRHYQEISGRAASDEKDETAAGARYTPGEIAQLLRSMGGGGAFNAGEIEKTAKNSRNINDLEIYANNVLRQKTGAYHAPDTAGSIAKCVFRDNALKPKTVTDVKLSINIPDSALIDPVFYSYAAAKHLIKDIICRHIIESIDQEINSSAQEPLEERIIGLFAETAGFNLSNARGNIAKNAEIEHIRACGFNTAVNALMAILDNAALSYQFIENRKNGRELVIREYEDSEPANLPDERYAIRLWYFDRDQLAEDCKAYDAQVKNLEHEVQHLWDLIEVIYQDSKSVFKVNDFEDLAKKNKSRIRDIVKRKTGETPHEITGETGDEKGNIPARLARMHERIKNMYEYLYPVERRVMEERLVRLEKEYSRIDFITNPRCLQSGLLVDIELTTIKRKKTTLDSLAAALEELLNAAYEGFQDAAFASFGADAAETSSKGVKALRAGKILKPQGRRTRGAQAKV